MNSRLLRLFFFACLLCLSQIGYSEDRSALSNETYVVWSESQVGEIRRRATGALEAGDFFMIRTTAYDVRTNVNREFTAALSLYVDTLAVELRKSSLFIEIEDLPTRPIVTILKNKSQYIEYLGNNSFSRGWFSWKYDKEKKSLSDLHIITYVSNDAERKFENFYVPILHHEFIHMFMRVRAGNKEVPLFLSEGIAMFYQYWRIGEKNFKLRNERSTFRVRAVQLAVKNKIPDLSVLLDLKGKWDVDNYGPTTLDRYALAESFVAFMMSTESGRALLRGICLAVSAGKDIGSILDRSRLNVLNADWKEYVRNHY